jgi:hypothetical protein
MRTWVKALPVLLIAACTAGQSGSGGGAGGLANVDLSVGREQYDPGDAILLTLANHSPNQVGYNLCSAALERRVGGGEWHEAPQRLIDACTMELRTLVPNETVTYRHSLPSALPAGQYRVRTRVEAPLGRLLVNVSSAPFMVGAF